MGRTLDVTNLTKSEQDNIVQVIRRDLALRKNEVKRIDVLHKHLPKKEQSNNSSEECVVCGAGFFWLFNSKAKCKFCGNFFCKSKITCGRSDVGNEGWLCIFCYQEREVQSRSLEWFYAHLKTKFRRHGGAKVLRELYKRNKKGVNQGETPNVPLMRKEIERTIASSLVSKIEEIKSLLEESHCEEENKQVAEDVLEQFFENNQSHHEMADELLWRYLKDHKQYIKMRILREASMLKKDGRPGSSSVRDAETMTEASDSELESLPSCSGSLRSRNSWNNLSLSGRGRSFNSTGSLQSLLLFPEFDNSKYTIVQGVLKPKETVSSFDLNAAMLEDFDHPDVDSDTGNDVSFNAELKFTAVDEATPLTSRSAIRKSSTSSTSDKEDLGGGNDNWVVAQLKAKANLFSKKHTYLPHEGAQSAYEHITSSENDADVIEDQAVEEAILPMTIKRDLSDVSARSLSCNVVEIATSKPLLKQTWSLEEPEIEDIMHSLSNEIESGVQDKLAKKSQSSQVQEEEIKATQIAKHEEDAKDSDIVKKLELKETEEKHSITSSRKTKVSQAIFPKRINPTEIGIRRENNTNQANAEVTRFEVSFGGEDEHEDELDKHFSKAYDRITTNYDLNELSDASTEENQHKERPQKDVDSVSTSSDSAGNEKSSYDDEYRTSDRNKLSYLNKNKLNDTAVQNIEFEPIDDVERNFRNNEDVVQNTEFEPTDKVDRNLQNNKVISLSTNAEAPSKHSSVSSSSSSSDQSDDEEPNKTLLVQATDDVTSSHVQANSSTQDEPEFVPRKSIDQIVRDLQTAGLAAKKTKFNRSSFTSNRIDHSKSKPNYRSESMKKNYESPPVNARVTDFDLNVYSFKVDPATYKKKPKLIREVSLQSLISSDNESVMSDASTRSPRPESCAPNADVIPTLASVASRRSLFNKSSEDISTRKANIQDHQNPNKSIGVRDPSHSTLKSPFVLPNMVIIEDSVKELTAPIEQRNRESQKTSILTTSPIVIPPKKAESNFIDDRTNSKNSQYLRNGKPQKNVLKAQIESEIATPRSKLNSVTPREANGNSKLSFQSKDENQITSKKELKSTVIFTEIPRSNGKSDQKSNKSYKEQDAVEKMSSQKKSDAPCIKKLSPSHRQALEESLSFNRGSPVRGSLTMRGSRAGYLPENVNKVALSPSVPEENEKVEDGL